MAAAVRVRDAINRQEGLSTSERADRLAILWFMAEAEGVASAMLTELIGEEKLMESELYRSIIQKGFQKGIQKGKDEGVQQGIQQSSKQTIVRILARRLGYLDESIVARIQAEQNQPVLDAWLEGAIGAFDESSAQRLVEQIRKAPPSAALG